MRRATPRFCWAYPVGGGKWSEQAGAVCKDQWWRFFLKLLGTADEALAYFSISTPSSAFFVYGGYIYFDKRGRVVAMCLGCSSGKALPPGFITVQGALSPLEAALSLSLDSPGIRASPPPWRADGCASLCRISSTKEHPFTAFKVQSLQNSGLFYSILAAMTSLRRSALLCVGERRRGVAASVQGTGKLRKIFESRSRIQITLPDTCPSPAGSARRRRVAGAGLESSCTFRPPDDARLLRTAALSTCSVSRPCLRPDSKTSHPGL